MCGLLCLSRSRVESVVQILKLYGVLSVVYSVCDCALSDVRFSDTANSCQSFFKYCTFLTAWCHARPFHTLFSVSSFLSSTRMRCPQCLFYVCSFLSLGTLSSTRNTLLTHCLVCVPWCFTPNLVFHQTCAAHSAVWCMYLIVAPHFVCYRRCVSRTVWYMFTIVAPEFCCYQRCNAHPVWSVFLTVSQHTLSSCRRVLPAQFGVCSFLSLCTLPASRCSFLVPPDCLLLDLQL